MSYTVVQVILLYKFCAEYVMDSMSLNSNIARRMLLNDAEIQGLISGVSESDGSDNEQDQEYPQILQNSFSQDRNIELNLQPTNQSGRFLCR